MTQFCLIVILLTLLSGHVCLAQNASSFDCRASPCVHGICLIDPSNPRLFRCMCELGYTGSHCQLNYDECSLNRCRNNATCEDLVGSFRCHCLPGFTGELCETLIDNCAANPCQNSGICINRPNDYKCYCPFGYIGRNCEIDVNVCSSDHCRNNGTCIEGAGYDYSCQCLPGFSGRNCESLIDPCSHRPCENGGRCVATSFVSYACTCPCDFTGNRCELRAKPCTESDHINCVNGICRRISPFLNTTDEAFEPRCFCSPGYTGLTCNQHFPACLRHNNLCENGGHCRDTDSGYECVCNNIFGGKHCELNCELGQCPATNPSSETMSSMYLSSTFIHETNESQDVHSSIVIVIPTTEIAAITSVVSVAGSSLDPNNQIDSVDISPSSSYPYFASPSIVDSLTFNIPSFTFDSYQLIPSLVIESHLDSTSMHSILMSSTATPKLTFDMTTSLENVETITLNSNYFSSHSPLPIVSTLLPEVSASISLDSELLPSSWSFASSSSVELDTSIVFESNTFEELTITPTESNTAMMTTSKPLDSTFNAVISTLTIASASSLPSTESITTPTAAFPNLPVSVTTNEPLNVSTESTASIWNEPMFSARFRSDRESRLLFIRDPYDAPLYFRLQFDFISNRSDGVLLHAQPRSRSDLFAVVFLQASRLKYAFSCHTNRVVFIQSDLRLPRDSVHRLQLQFKLDIPKRTCFADVSLNDSAPVFASQTADLPFLDRLCVKHFQFGRLIESNDSLPVFGLLTPFDGCMQNIELNGRPRYVYSANVSQDVTECDGNRICAQHPCRNGGLCRMEGTSSSLTMDSFLYTNNQTTPTSASLRWQCHCQSGFFGRFCEYSTCDPNPCSSNSTCLLPSSYEYTCLCPKWKFGKECQYDLRLNKFYFDDKLNSFLIYSFANTPNFLEIHFNLTLSGSELTDQPAILMFMGQNYNQAKPKSDFLLLTINNEAITLRLNLGKSTKEISTRFIRHELLHEVRLGHSDQFIWLSVDNYDHSEDRLSGDYETLDVQDRLYVAGHRYSDGIDQLRGLRFFSGCIFNVAAKQANVQSSLVALDKVIYSHNVSPCPEINCRR